MKDEIIKKIRLKKGCKYILIFPESAGLTARGLQDLNYKAEVDLSFLVKSTRGIKVVEK